MALVLLAAAGVTVWLALPGSPLRRTLYGWTGEEDARQQVRGSLAYLALHLTRPQPHTDPYVPMLHTDLPPYGVNTFLEQEVEAEKVDRSMALIRQAGFFFVRQQFPWEDIEIAGKDDFWDHKWDVSAWAKYDRLVDAAERHGLEIIARLDNPPGWTRTVGDAAGWVMGPPDDLEDYGDYVYAVVSRYRGRVRYYQIWNEPNIYPEWGDQDVDPEAYVRLLEVAYRRAKEADPGCVILSGGLAQTTEQGPRNLSDLIYLERMYAAGAAEYFDIMGAMTYGLWTGPTDRRVGAERTNYARVQLLREIMVRHGDAHKPIWATEVGWNASPETLAEYPRYGRVAEEAQARYAVEAYQRAAREWPWLSVLNYWFLRRPSDLEREQTWYYFRMLEPGFEPLPVYHALADLATAPPALQIGYHQESHWAIAYEGAWRTVEDADAVLGHYALGDEGAEARFTAWGTHLALVLRHPEDLQRIAVEVDGRPVTRLRPLAMASTPDAPVYAVGGRLPDRPLEVRVRVTEGEAGLDGVVIMRRPSPWPAWAGLGLVATIAAVVSALQVSRRRRSA